ncbi:hypothetical protein A9Q99_04550 [Gammaproteobacteria bacterium 45_16_T64]|nr:hypothetical protein A9Q99_04550 [Gammaproteobacteria bacterium 45_16_T64]
MIDTDEADVGTGIDSRRRAAKALRKKIKASRQHFLETRDASEQEINNDEQRYQYERYYASYSKTLPCNQFGEVDPQAFESLQRALQTGAATDFNNIPLDSTASRRLTNPQGAFRFEIAGLDSHATRINPAWTFRSADLAGEMVEVYWQALTRDVPFSEYSSSTSIQQAITDLNLLSATPGSVANGSTSVANIFRGETVGDLNGPQISQFLWQGFDYGPSQIEQRYDVGLAGVDFMVDEANWLNVQRGGTPNEGLGFDSTPRYIYNNRALSEYVHRDVLFQAYLNAAFVMLGYGPDAIATGNPYKQSHNQDGFTSLGGPFILDMVTKAGNTALAGAWFQKWRVHRFLRPEVLAGRVHFHQTNQREYELHSDLLNSAAVNEVFSLHGTGFCPQAYTEGSPTHPSFPAGHATIAGCCATILKACFNEDFVIQNPVVADATGDNLLPYIGSDLTLGGEINKLANNISIGRDAAGVHYRQDGVQGMAAGEQLAIGLLQDHSRTIHESDFFGFTLTRFDGRVLNINDGDVTEV